jgi:hypothetical protein
MTATAQAATGLTIVIGNCESQEIKGDWHSFHIRHRDSQYPLKLTTKKPELVALATAVGKQLAEWGYLEQQGNPNPNKPGSFYTNRYLSTVTVLDQDRPQILEAITDERRQELIVRQSCLKAAVEHVSNQSKSGAVLELGVLPMAEMFEAWVWRQRGVKVQTEDFNPAFIESDIPFGEPDVPFQ